MNKIYFEKILEKGFIKGNEVDNKLISSTPLRNIIDLSQELAELTSGSNLKKQDSIFTHSASLSLSGYSRPCADPECRLSRINELAQFAALYSDRVYIRNYLTDFLRGPEDDSEIGFRLRFYKDLFILSKIRPLIEKGIIIPFSPPTNYCPHCLVKKDLGKEERKRIDKLYKSFSGSLLKNMSVDVRYKSGSYNIKIVGPEKFIEHGSCVITRETPPEFFKSTPKLLSNVKSGKIVSLSPSAIKKSNLHEIIVDFDFESVGFELAAAQSIGSSFLTERDLHIEILNTISEDQNISIRNQILKNHLTAIVPFVHDVDATDLIKIREREPESFIMFRRSLNEAIDEYKKTKGTFTKKDAIALYSDVIQPRLAELDRKIKSAKSDLKTTATRKIVSWVGAISFGIYSGFVPSDLIIAASSLGFTKVVADLIEMVMNQSDAEKHVRSDNLYFLWKVKDLSKR